MYKIDTVKTKTLFNREAGRLLGEELVQKLGGYPSACWLFCAPKDGLEELLRGIHESVGTKNLVGCTSDAEIYNEELNIESAVLGGILTDQIDFSFAHVEGIGKDGEKAGRELGRRISVNAQYIQLFSDGLTGNGCAILRGLVSVLGEDVPISGGTAGDAGRFRQTWQFSGDKVLTDSAVAVAFSGDFSVGIGIQSGWSPIGLAKKVTRASGNILYELNEEPALKVYKRFLGRHAERLPEVGVEYPLILLSDYRRELPEGYNLLRATMSVNHEDESIRFAGDIPEGTMVCMTCGDIKSILEASEKATRQALESLDNKTPIMTFCFSCMARRIVLGRHAIKEVECIRQTIHTEIPLLGFYTYGEYAPLKRNSAVCLHNESIVVSIIGI